MGKTKRNWIAGAILVAVLCGGGLLWLAYSDRESAGLPPSGTDTGSEESVALSAWLVDWQLSAGSTDYNAVAERLSSLQLFALYFNDKDGLHYTPELRNELPALLEHVRKASELEVYLTVVNDIWRQDGTAVQKDASLVTRLMATEHSRQRHVQELVAAAAEHRFDGIEIDYERIAESDWDNLTVFYGELYEQLTARGMKLRILFEPRAPIEELTAAAKLPEGPEYVMMAYNLFGSHSGPGPKADEAFLRQLARRGKDIPGGMGFALSAGGFDWAQEGKAAAVTEQKGAQLAEQHRAERQRDPDSGAVFYDYTDEEGRPHTVWYADAGTFERWIEALKDEGIYRISLWRLGELGSDTLRYLRELE